MKTVVITAAENMSDATYARICRGFREKLGDDVKFERVTDNGIIGGFIADALFCVERRKERVADDLELGCFGFVDIDR